MLGVSSIVLFACVFLPVVRVCGTPTAPWQFPPDYVVYIAALLIGIKAFSTTPATRRGLFATVVTLWLVTGFAIAALSLGAMSAPAGIFIGLTSTVGTVFIIRAIVRARPGDTPMKVVEVLHGLVSLGWYGFLAADPEGMWGIYPGLLSSLVLLVAALAQI